MSSNEFNGIPNGLGVHDFIEDMDPPSATAGCTGMYCSGRPYQLPEDVQLPNCMYQVLPIKMQQDDCHLPVSVSSHNLLGNSTSRGTLTIPKTASSVTMTNLTSSVSTEALDALEQRQLNIIDQLKALREVISYIHEKCVDAGSTTPAVSSSTNIQNGIDIDVEKQLLAEENIDIVISANPSRPPYSLLFFASLLEYNYSNAVVSIKSHVHSSYKGKLDKKNLAMFEKEKAGANFKFTLIWKNVDSCTMILSPVKSTYIRKEENIARFLSRLLPASSDSMNYDCLNWDALVKVDNLLEHVNDKNLPTIIENELKKSKCMWLIGKPTIADLVLYSAVTSNLFNGQKNITPGVMKWVKSLVDFYNGSLSK